MTGVKIYRNKPKIVVRAWEICDATCITQSMVTRQATNKRARAVLLNGTIVISGELELNFQKIVGHPPQGDEKIFVIDHFKILARKIWRLQNLL